jgi:hypothetical protein
MIETAKMHQRHHDEDRQGPPLLIFEHIPKTAGSTMLGILWQLHRPGQVFMSCNPGEYCQQFARLSTHLSEANCPVRVLVSHAGYGAHEVLPNPHRFQHFTMLRDPVERTVSHFFHAKRKREIPRNQSLERYVADDPIRRRNAHANFLAGEKARLELEGLTSPNDYQPPSDLFEQAASVLESKIDAFGFTERFDEAIVLFRHVFGWPLFRTLYVRRNVRPIEDRGNQLSDSDMKLVAKANEVDIELYDFAQRLYARRVAELGFDIRQRVTRYRRLNRAHEGIRPVLYPVARPFVHLGRRVGLL